MLKLPFLNNDFIFDSSYPLIIDIIECEGWRRHSSLIFLILLFTKPNIEVSGWLYQTKTHFTHIVYQPFSRVSPPSFTLYGSTKNYTRIGCSSSNRGSLQGFKGYGNGLNESSNRSGTFRKKSFTTMVQEIAVLAQQLLSYAPMDLFLLENQF